MEETEYKKAIESITCISDCFYFIDNYIKISNPVTGKTVDFKLYDYQKDVLYEWLVNKYTICKKPRQMGITTLAAAYSLWTCLKPNQNVLAISLQFSAAQNFLKIVKNMYQNLPNYLRVRIINGNKDKVTGHHIGTGSVLEFENRSSIEICASTENAGRGKSLSVLIMDEVAFQEYASQIWTSSQQTIATGGQAILFSSVFGVGNFFHKTYTDAEQNLNGFKAIALNWRQHPERDENWYNTQRMVLGEKRLAQEVDCEFLTSGYSVFDLEAIRALEDKLNNKRPVEVHENGQLLIYSLPESGVVYVIGADVATGRGRDYSAFSIMTSSGKEVACYKGKIGTREFAHLLIKMGYKYNTAWLAPETNSVGEGVTAILQECNYPNIYNSVTKLYKYESMQVESAAVQGWYTNNKNRYNIITGMDDDLKDDLVDLNNPFFVAEAYNFIYDAATNKPIARGKKGASAFEDDITSENIVYNDDAIFAVCIANEVRKYIPKLKHEKWFFEFDVSKHISNFNDLKQNYPLYIVCSFTETHLIYHFAQYIQRKNKEELTNIYLFNERVIKYSEIEEILLSDRSNIPSNMRVIVTGQNSNDFNKPHYIKILETLNLKRTDLDIATKDISESLLRPFINNILKKENLSINQNSNILIRAIQSSKLDVYNKINENTYIKYGPNEALNVFNVVDGFRMFLYIMGIKYA